MPAMIFSKGSLVADDTGGSRQHAPVGQMQGSRRHALTIATASAQPCSPLQALALPELTTMARANPSFK